MTITWHWQDEDREGRLCHARKQFTGETLCGAPSYERPLMRPPFPKVRCAACEEARGTEVQIYPNPYCPVLGGEHTD